VGPPNQKPLIFEVSGFFSANRIGSFWNQIFGDVRNLNRLGKTLVFKLTDCPTII
jgi:hypothetical protein